MAKTADELVLECFRDVSQSLDADIYVISGGLYYPLDDETLGKIAAVPARKKSALLILTTFGGDPDVAYRIARGFQRAYSKGDFIVLVPWLCKSAGTLLSIGATKLIMTDDSQLGPLDVQVDKPDAIGEKMSGQTPCQSLAFLQEHAFDLFEYSFFELLKRSKRQVTFITATRIATELTTGLLSPVYAHLDPMRLGEYHRDMMIAFEYGKRLGEHNLVSEAALRRLTHEYPSHSFVIDRDEAKELFINVEEPSPRQTEMLGSLMPFIRKDLVHQDASGNYVGVARFIRLDIPLTPKDAPQKEVRPDEKDADNQPKSTEAEHAEPEPKGNGGVGTGTDRPQETPADAGGTAGSQPAPEVVEQSRKGKK